MTIKDADDAMWDAVTKDAAVWTVEALAPANGVAPAATAVPAAGLARPGDRQASTAEAPAQ